MKTYLNKSYYVAGTIYQTDSFSKFAVISTNFGLQTSFWRFRDRVDCYRFAGKNCTNQ